jgi:hypothetical protein
MSAVKGMQTAPVAGLRWGRWRGPQLPATMSASAAAHHDPRLHCRRSRRPPPRRAGADPARPRCSAVGRPGSLGAALRRGGGLDAQRRHPPHVHPMTGDQCGSRPVQAMNACDRDASAREGTGLANTRQLLTAASGSRSRPLSSCSPTLTPRTAFGQQTRTSPRARCSMSEQSEISSPATVTSSHGESPGRRGP